MKKILLYIGIALAAIGCTKDADFDTLSSDNALTITSNIATRVTGNNWDAKDAIGVYVYPATSLVENVEFITKDGDGTFTSESAIYLPSDVTSVFAYYPYKESVDLTAYSINSVDQVDILSATNDDVSSSSVALQFNHLLSKLSLTITNGTGVSTDDLVGLAVTISGIYTEATFDLTSSSNQVTTTSSAASLTLTTADDGTSSSAIVIPQSLSGATLLFTTAAGDKYSATIPAKEFATGLEYAYTITIKESKVEITSATINGWNEGTATSGTADLFYDIEGKSDGVLYINSAAGLKAFADLVNGTENTTAAYAGFDYVDYGDAATKGVSFGTSYPKINGVLTSDINLSTICSAESNTSWTPIGSSIINNYYDGTFDGGGYEVSGLYIDASTSIYQGLFGVVYGNGATIKNLGVDGSVTSSHDYAYVGGIVGAAYNLTIIGCYNNATVEGNDYVGGIVGYAEGASGTTIAACYNSGAISGSGDYIGGVVGCIFSSNSTVTSCYSYGSVSSNNNTSYIGGVVGRSYDSSTISYCYYDTSVIEASSATNKPSGVVGESSMTDATDSSGLTTAQMTAATGTTSALIDYLSQSSYSSYWSTTLYENINSGYPILTWQVTND